MNKLSPFLQVVRDEFAATLRWARRQSLRVDVIYQLPKAAQRAFIMALLDAYVHGYEAAVAEFTKPLDGGSDVQR